MNSVDLTLKTRPKMKKTTDGRYLLGRKIRPQKDADGNEGIQRRPPRWICFLGASGIGKSCLINTLVEDRISVVPAGGIGPSTAQAVIVQYGKQLSLTGEYHSKDLIYGLLKDLGGTFKTLDQIQQKEETNAVQESIKKARLLITGDQENHKEVKYLVDGLQAVVEGNIIYGSKLDSQDVRRIDVIKAMMGKEKFECKAGENYKYYRKYLIEHATSFLVPIVKSLRVRVKSELLARGLVLVDLPGVGVDGDIHQNVTKDYLLNKADAAVLVISTRGIGDAEHRMMKTGGIYERMLPPQGKRQSRSFLLIIAVTRVDDIAVSRFIQDRSKKKWEHFTEVCAETENQVRKQLKEFLEEELITLGRNNVPPVNVDSISKGVEIVPVSAVEFRRFCTRDPDDKPFITNARQSNIPRLRKLLSDL